ncbi:hypothetical protein Phi12:1_gp26 [Cellulophaga phage phi12:1]|uniref:Uncharacterized protein n=2 Tax=Cellulophaga phage phi12:1 TaxID=1327976 RepID=S0A0F7_9CAUD|nr:hypothetical protein Phi12:1_gp26 [Cellulophaga phage phi12:1]AGO47992.1 hypothetical protein Phi12:1_gp26 [Cellulophaga phage phi12:1]AGO48157.1 hypothetical protein Phi12:3_gp26 [Cellulophaga phage phi12:3]
MGSVVKVVKVVTLTIFSQKSVKNKKEPSYDSSFLPCCYIF